MSQLVFNPDTGLEAPESESIRQAVAADWTEAFFDTDLPPLNTEPTSPAGQLIDAEVAEIEAKNSEMSHLASMFNPALSEGRWQEALGYIYFLKRKADEPTVVTCQLSGLRGTSIPYGALVQSSNGYTLICNRAVNIGNNGTAETTFRVSENGPVEIPAGAVNSIVTTIPGWDTVNNEAAGALGREKESRSEFEARRALSVAVNAHGSTGALFGAIADIAGVLDVQVLENIGPDPVIKYGVTVPGHGVTICVYGGEDADIAEAIYNKKDNGADTGGNTSITHLAADYHNAVYEYKIMRPETVNFWAKVVLGSGVSLADSQISELKNAIYNDFYGLNTVTGNARVGLASTIYASRFYAAALAVEGIKNIQSIEIALSQSQPSSTGYAGLVNIGGDQEPVMALSNVNVEVA